MHRFVAILFVLFFVIVPNTSSAQPAGPFVGGGSSGVSSAFSGVSGGSAGSVVDQALQTMKKKVDDIAGRLTNIVQQGMLALLVVDFVLRGGRAVIGNDGIEGFLKGFVFQLGFVALVWLVSRTVPEFVKYLGDVVGEISSKAGGKAVSPGDIISNGISDAVSLLGNISLTSPGTWFYLVAAGVSVVVLAITVAMIVVIWAELYLVGLAGMVALIFGGLSETRDMAVGYIKALIGKAFKLLGLLIVLSTTQQITSAISSTGGGLEAAAGTMLLQIVAAVLVLTLPASIESLIVGANIGSRAAEAVGGAVKSVAGAAMKGIAGAAAGAVAGGVTGAVSGAMRAGGSGAGGRLGGAAKGAAKGAVKGGVNWAGIAARGDTVSTVMRGVTDKISGVGSRAGG